MAPTFGKRTPRQPQAARAVGMASETLYRDERGDEDVVESEPSIASILLKRAIAWAKLHPIATALIIICSIGALAPSRDKSASPSKDRSAATAARNNPAGSCNDDLRQAAQRLISAHGYSCASVDFCSPAVMSYTVSVTCDNRYSYELRDRGGIWNVTVD